MIRQNKQSAISQSPLAWDYDHPASQHGDRFSISLEETISLKLIDCRTISGIVIPSAVLREYSQSSRTRNTDPSSVSVSWARVVARWRSSSITRTRTHQFPTGLTNFTTLAVW